MQDQVAYLGFEPYTPILELSLLTTRVRSYSQVTC